MKTTKFEITMTIEVKDVGDVPANGNAIQSSIIYAVENISTGDVVNITKIATSQRTKIIPKVVRKGYGSSFCNSLELTG